ncbi:hypothetical protein BN1232_06322 [Mycobacterium lentiflavum]|uniref:Uncharacterized protein n=2 Tax=Mycobacterium simiae complex TaxID=2249310 RepID=A0A0E4CRL7_MYCLN|nr:MULTISPECIES: hypothetical protein [Mycobacterium simiae complex]ORJ52693.1 hypothetical protein B5M45_30350 [Mycobacterium simiae]ULP45562.1 hypothetical protein MJO58_27870 [Mycobacterium lentiflavum]CQD24677.1 hypothetical protein BN1232_06322 [Mycobacterium lentiflavum]
MYDLVIEHHSQGLSLSVHPDRRDAGAALDSYHRHVDCTRRPIQLTEPFTSYELVDLCDGQTIAIATIERRRTDPITDQQFTAAKAAVDESLALASAAERHDIQIAWDQITGAINHTTHHSPPDHQRRQP